MSFGQQGGPPASAKQLAYLLSLLKQAGYDDFRDTRRGLRLTQRQGGGKFTTKEASDLIDQLLGSDVTETDRSGPDHDDAGAAGDATQGDTTQGDPAVRDLPAGVLAGELERRGWTCEPPRRRR